MYDFSRSYVATYGGPTRSARNVEGVLTFTELVVMGTADAVFMAWLRRLRNGLHMYKVDLGL